MAVVTYRIPLGSILLPAETGIFKPAVFSVEIGTNFDYSQVSFPEAANSGFLVQFPVPASYAGGAKTARLWWKTTETSGDVKWDIHPLVQSAGDTFDTAFSAAGATTDTAPGSAGDLAVTSCTIPLPAWTAADSVQLYIERDAIDGTDTLTGSVELVYLDIDITIP